jgi:putative transcriptional regulator
MDNSPVTIRPMSRAIAALIVGALFVITPSPQSEAATSAIPSPSAKSEPPPTQRSLKGKLLVAEPGMSDPRFSRTVIFVVRHDDTGAFGLVVNRRLASMPAASLFKRPEDDPSGGDIAVHYGGPVEPQTAFVLHTTDYKNPPTIPVNDQYAVTQTEDILKAMTSKSPPAGALFMLGYAGWGKGQLAQELARGSWAVAPAAADIVFGDSYNDKWKRAYDRRYQEI